MGHGNRGSSQQSANTLAAERADRISRLPGLERMAAGSRTTPSGHLIPAGGYTNQLYDNAPQFKERSTVGSASATGSVGGGRATTWASDSNMDVDTETDKMSDNADDGVSSGGFSDEDKGSLVGFGEGAGSTVSGPVSSNNPRFASTSASARNSLTSPLTPRTGAGLAQSGGSTPMSGIVQFTSGAGNADTHSSNASPTNNDASDATYFPQSRPDQPATSNIMRDGGVGTELAENLMRDRIRNHEGGQRALETPLDSKSLGRFEFEKE